MDVTKEICSALRTGNAKKIEKLFEQVYASYSDLVFVVISKYVTIKEDIEELTDDTFIALFKNLKQLDSHKNIKYYLMVIAKNLSIDYLRKKKVEVELNEEILASPPTSSYYLMIEEWKEILNLDEIRMVLLHVLYGYELKEIAHEQQKSVNTVKSIYRRAMKKLQAKYKEVF